MTTKVDFKNSLPGYRAKLGVFTTVNIPPMNYLMIDGHGDPNTSPRYTEALSALYPVAYALKFASRTETSRDYVVPPLEGLWWAEDMSAFTRARDKSQWEWTMMIMVPDWLGAGEVDAAISKVAAKNQPARLGDVRLDCLVEGTCVQTLHIGSFDDEAPVLERLHREYIDNRGLQPTRKHHEIYFSDARKVAPAKLRTLLRQPVVAAK